MDLGEGETGLGQDPMGNAVCEYIKETQKHASCKTNMTASLIGTYKEKEEKCFRNLPNIMETAAWECT